jgi:hypothetical protein
VLWTDYFKPPHFEKYPQLHTLFNEATKLAGAAGTKGELGRRQGRRAAGQDRRDRQDLLGDQEGLSVRSVSLPRARRGIPDTRKGPDGDRPVRALSYAVVPGLARARRPRGGRIRIRGRGGCVRRPHPAVGLR